MSAARSTKTASPELERGAWPVVAGTQRGRSGDHLGAGTRHLAAASVSVSARRACAQPRDAGWRTVGAGNVQDSAQRFAAKRDCAIADLCLLPCACHNGIGTPDCIAFAAQYLAYTPPLSALGVLPRGSDPRASLGASVDRYSFTVTDFRHLSPAALPGAPQLNTWPVVSPVNAPRRPSRDAAHHSGLGRLARPFPWGTLTSYFFASFPGALSLGPTPDSQRANSAC
jgi:hypothetical protein